MGRGCCACVTCCTISHPTFNASPAWQAVLCELSFKCFVTHGNLAACTSNKHAAAALHNALLVRQVHLALELHVRTGSRLEAAGLTALMHLLCLLKVLPVPSEGLLSDARSEQWHARMQGGMHMCKKTNAASPETRDVSGLASWSDGAWVHQTKA